MFDREQAERYVEILTGSRSTRIVIQQVDDSKVRGDRRFSSVMIGTVAELADRIAKANDLGCAIYVQVIEGKGRGAKYITTPRACFADDDAVTAEERRARNEPPCPRCGVHHDGALPPLITVPPTMIVQTSADPRHCHYYWKLALGTSLERWSELQARIACALRTDPSMKNVDRVMRLPGTMNRKVEPARGRDGTPFPVRILENG